MNKIQELVKSIEDHGQGLSLEEYCEFLEELHLQVEAILDAATDDLESQEGEDGDKG